MAAPSFLEMIAGAAADLANAATGKLRLFMDTATGLPAVKDDAGTVTSLVGPTGPTGPTGPDGAGVPPTVVAHGSMGATETFDYGDGPSHEGTVNASLTVTLTGAVAGECIVSLGLTNDGTPGHTLTLPGSVSNAAEIEAAFDTTAGAYNLIVLRTVDSGTTWYGLRVGSGATGATGAAGADGISGGAVSIPYVFSTTTTDSDPGSGNLRLSNATQTSATVIRADLLASDGTDWSAVLATLADSTNTVKGHIRLYLTADPTKWLVFSVSAVASPSGYKNITVANVAGSSASPFSNADPITLSFTRAGDVGASGTASVATDPIWDAAGDLAVGTGADTAARMATSGLSGATSYTPVLTAATTNPTLGSGSAVEGHYIQIGKLVIAWGSIAFGSSGTNAGSGEYHVSLPVAAVSTSPRVMGSALIYNASQFVMATPYFSSTTVCRLVLTGVNLLVSNGAPGAWGANWVLIFTFMYEAA